MPVTVRLETFEEVDGKDALVLVAFPTTGAAAPIAAHYLTRHLTLPLVGHIRVPALDHLMAIEDGIASSVIRMYGGELVCKLDAGCPCVFLITTEIQIPPEVMGDVSDAILAWAGKHGVHMVLSLEGVNRDEDDDVPDVYTASSQEAVLKELDTLEVPRAERAFVGGLSSMLVLQGADHNVRTATLLVEANPQHPDGRAAAALIQVLDKLLPDVPVDSAPLLSEAEELERQIRKATQPSTPTPALSPSFI